MKRENKLAGSSYEMYAAPLTKKVHPVMEKSLWNLMKVVRIISSGLIKANGPRVSILTGIPIRKVLLHCRIMVQLYGTGISG